MRRQLNDKITIIIALLIGLMLGAGAYGTSFSQASGAVVKRAGVPNFFFDVANVESKKAGHSKINVYIKIAYDELQFLVVDSVYRAGYEVSVVIFDEKGEQADGEIWQEEVFASTYENTNSKELFSLTHVSFDLTPSKYRMSIGFMDLDTKKTTFKKLAFQVREFGKKKLEVSDITIVSNLTFDSLGVKSIHPEIASYIKEKQRMLYGYYEIYSDREVESFNVSYFIKNQKREEILKGNKEQPKEGHRTMAYVDLDAGKLSHGNYVLELTIDDGKQMTIIAKPFSIRWLGIPSSVVDIDLAIEQLRYIASSSEIKRMKNSPEGQKVKEFEKFWKERDPSPGTQQNEHMDEYYRRINYSNENFSGFREGWKSDMGMIYVIFGQPNDVERHPFESGYKPYEVWYYYEINRQFVFIDETGFGEYRLVTRSWEHWRRDVWRP